MSKFRAEREAARLRGEKRFTPTFPCTRGHTSERYTSTGNCIECMRFTVDTVKVANHPQIKQFILKVPRGLTEEHLTILRQDLQSRLETICESWGLK